MKFFLSLKMSVRFTKTLLWLTGGFAHGPSFVFDNVFGSLVFIHELWSQTVLFMFFIEIYTRFFLMLRFGVKY